MCGEFAHEARGGCPVSCSPATGSLTGPGVRLIPASSSGPPVYTLNSDGVTEVHRSSRLSIKCS